MPIKGLTDNVALSFPFIGSLRKGAKKPDATHIGQDLTYFRAVFTDSERDAAIAFFNTYGAEPHEVNILLPFPDPDRNFEAWQEEYTAGALQHRCDGATCVIWRDKDGAMHRDPKPCPGGCKPVGRLKVIIPELRRLAFLVVHTTSVWDIQELTRNLAALRALTGNGVNGIPLLLKRRPREISTPWKDGKRARRAKWLLSIEADPAWVDCKLAEMKHLATPGLADLPQIAAPEADETEEVTAEYEDDSEQGHGPDWDHAADWDNDDGDEQAATAQPEPDPNAHPWPPEAVKADIARQIAAEKRPAWRTGKATPAQRQTLAILFSQAVKDNHDDAKTVDLKRHSVLMYLVGKQSTADITMCEASALIAWQQDAAIGREEAHRIVNALNEQAGQAALPLPEPAE